jgi:DNA-directed RNA polymerase alpha subunit
MTTETKTLPDDKRHLSMIEALQRDADAAESEYEKLKSQTASAKKIWEAKCRSKAEYIRKLSAPMPLFELWRQASVAELGLPEIIVTLLCESGLETIGKIADYSESGKRLTDIPNIGEKKAEVIERALEEYWRKRKESEEEGAA